VLAAPSNDALLSPCSPAIAPASAAQASDGSTAVKHSKVMIVDDESMNIKIVQRLLELEGYSSFVTTTDSTRAVQLILDEQPDIILLDLMMPHVSGLDLLAQLRGDAEGAFIPVIILTAVCDNDTRLSALELGATDFLNKPVDASELIPRVRNVLTVKAYQDGLERAKLNLEHYSHDLEAAVKQRTAELEASRRDVIHCLARAAEYRDDDTGHHVLRVGRYASLIGKALGLSDDVVHVLEQAAQLHDIGKIGIPDAVLLKPGKLTDEEFALMQKHAGLGKRILRRLPLDEETLLRQHAQVGSLILEVGSSPVLEMAREIALTHHEWWNGTGYPLGLSGENIPLVGRITAVADVFDALSTKRCYKPAFPLEKCFEIMQQERGTHFDPRVLDAFWAVQKEVVAIQLSFADEN
jgi:putative two-component system response regulator